MRRTLLGLTMLALGPPGALAGNAAPRRESPSIEASVDDAGRIVPRPATIETLAEGAPRPTAPPCSAANSMAPAAARELVHDIARKENFYPEFILAVASAESRFDVNAASPRGAFGLMQLEPATAERFHVDICDPADNVRGGIKFLRDLHARYKNPLFILAAYNAGEETLLRYRGVPPFPETVRFVATVLNEFYDWPAAGGTRPRLAATARAPRAARASDPSSPEARTAEDHWKSGFVWNVE